MKELSRNDLCPCGSGKKYKKCCMRSTKDPFAKLDSKTKKKGIVIKTEEQIEGIRRSSQLTKKILDRLDDLIRIGITTEEINTKVHEWTLEHGGYPATLNYKGFPKSTCTSLNNVICHGVPDKTVIKDGDILNVDITSVLNGYYGDASRMYLLGNVSEEAERLVKVTHECLQLGIEQVQPYKTLGDVGHAIQSHAEKNGYSVVTDFAGHGIGMEFHEEPQVLHTGTPRKGVLLLPNMVFTIEPMINAGRPESKVLKDGWTAVTADGSLSAQWEHTIRVTQKGYELLTV